MKSKLILGFTGLMASGKGASAEYLKNKYGAGTHRFSTMLGNVLDRFHLEHNRDNLIKISELVRTGFGEDIMAKTMANDVKKDNSGIIVVEGIRRMADIEYLKKINNFILIEIFADIEKRLERMHKRGEKSDDQTKTMEQFKADHQRSTELSILEVAKEATEVIDNNGSLENLYANLDTLIKRYGS